MCLVEVYNAEMGNEDKKHLAFVLALAGSAEQLLANGDRAAVQKIAQKFVYQYLKRPALITITQLFKRVSITFTQKAMAKAVPAGVGVAFSGKCPSHAPRPACIRPWQLQCRQGRRHRSR